MQFDEPASAGFVDAVGGRYPLQRDIIMSNRRSIPHDHPGKMLREQILETRSIKVAEAARQLGVARVTLSRVANESAAISVDLARRLEVWLGTPSASTWLYAQADWDLWQADQDGPPAGVTPYKDAGPGLEQPRDEHG